jgi:hypothetical protein
MPVGAEPIGMANSFPDFRLARKGVAGNDPEGPEALTLSGTRARVEAIRMSALRSGPNEASGTVHRSGNPSHNVTSR